jgi:cytoskeletal protein CcmA (bactofilin family)
MADSQVIDDAFINSMIGEGTRLRGDLDLNGLLRIDGDFSGTIRTKGKVLVGRNGRAECTVYAGTVVVGGIVRGNLFATERIVVLSTGMVIGNINTPRLIVEEGVLLNGTCTVEGQPRAHEAPRQPPRLAAPPRPTDGRPAASQQDEAGKQPARLTAAVPAPQRT